MLYMKCPDCKNEYTVSPVRFKPGSFVCQACGWTGDGFSPWGTLFDEDRWMESRQGVAMFVRRHAFAGYGFPVDLLRGHAAERDGVLLLKAMKPSGPHIAEYYHIGARGRAPKWVDCDSTGRPRSSGTFFIAWLHDEGRDAAYLCDSPLMALRVMEAWWLAEGRLPDIAWTPGHCGTGRPLANPGWLEGRHVLCIGGDGLLKALARRGIRADVRLRPERGMVPDNIYMTCRRMEDLANDPGNHGDTCELRMDGDWRRIHDAGLAGLGLAPHTRWTKLREVQKKCLPAGGVPKAIRQTPGFRREDEGRRKGSRKKRL